ncbi:MAG TPA: BlaI/MecI/CopY family transcriptional regulator [Opitutaceae bacterium]|jgi:predicted transcriptional regulator
MASVPLNQNELEVLRILWAGEERKPADIQEAFSWPIENATLRSVLVNLVEKGHVIRRLQGKAFFYSAKVPKATLLQGAVQALARVFSGGSTSALVAQLVETGDIGPADWEIIRQAAAGRTGKAGKRKAP